MASVRGFASLTELNLTYLPPISLRRSRFHPRIHLRFSAKPSLRIRCHRTSSSPARKFRELRLSRSVELDQFITSEEDEEISEGFLEAIEELERMAREPSDILEEMNHRLSSRELQLVLVYFAQDGRDSWCALEVFEWLNKENRVDEETMELMVSIMCGWVKKLIREDCDAAQVFDLLIDMECVGLKPGFSMIEKAIALYWETGKKEEAVLFVKEVLSRRDNSADSVRGADGAEGRKGGPTGYLAWKMMVDGDYKKAIDLVMELRLSGLKPEAYSHLIAMTAVVKELNSLAKALRHLKRFTKAGLVAEPDEHGAELIEKYQSDLISNGLKLASWAIQEGQDSSFLGAVHERLLAMYICAGRGPEAERQLWEMKLTGREPEPDLHDIVLAICASQKEVNAVSRLLARVEFMASTRKKKTLSWLLRGYVKGGHFEEAAETLVRMIDSGLCPEYMDRAAVMQGITRKIQRRSDVEAYMSLCKRLYDAGLVGPCLVYLFMEKYKLWIVNML
ncbi:PREDICTED: pentatricopeptide repeat-containing protein At2g30100, chloroplastic [Tarenaya hassleriana]|uniref:pentatricopeptide repeat-containing protein At2g30100, chloroplastic n=1 Tax=Tarenaya hassleriana TaxID=28532 RepID=UPI00053C51B2|nr:PREDICTED: pentatricopeptide repeat-containing protein At2g30100, chloroplastic [Tarenaya hassleriana]